MLRAKKICANNGTKPCQTLYSQVFGEGKKERENNSPKKGRRREDEQ